MRPIIAAAILATLIAGWPSSSRACSTPCAEHASITAAWGPVPTNLPGLHWQRASGGGFPATARIWRASDDDPVALTVEFVERQTHLVRIEGLLDASTTYEIELSNNCEEGT